MKQETDAQNGVWSTPQWFFDKLLAEFPMETDVCASPDNAKCEQYFTEEMDGLKQTWTGHCFMNPPYGDRGANGMWHWMRKAHDSAAEGSATVVCLIPARTDTEWWFDFAPNGEVRFLKGRLNFSECKGGGKFPSALVIFHAHLDPGRIVRWVTREEPSMFLYEGNPERRAR